MQLSEVDQISTWPDPAAVVNAATSPAPAPTAAASGRSGAYAAAS